MKEKLIEAFVNNLVSRFRKSSGLDHMVDNAKDYELRVRFDDRGATLRIEKVED